MVVSLFHVDFLKTKLSKARLEIDDKTKIKKF